MAMAILAITTKMAISAIRPENSSGSADLNPHSPDDVMI
jgi:hypothetical protein